MDKIKIYITKYDLMVQKVDRKYTSNYLLSSQSHVIQNEPINFVFVEKHQE